MNTIHLEIPKKFESLNRLNDYKQETDGKNPRTVIEVCECVRGG